MDNFNLKLKVSWLPFITWFIFIISFFQFILPTLLSGRI